MGPEVVRLRSRRRQEGASADVALVLVEEPVRAVAVEALPVPLVVASGQALCVGNRQTVVTERCPLQAAAAARTAKPASQAEGTLLPEMTVPPGTSFD